MASGVIFAELHVVAGERQEASNSVGVAVSPMLSLFKRRRGQLFTVTDPSRPGAESLCRRLIEVIEDEYFRVPSRSITRSLEAAISAANVTLRDENSRLSPERQLRVGLCCAAVRDGDVFVAQVAPASAFILHNGVVTRVFGSYSVSSESGNSVSHSLESLGSRLDPHINFGFSPIEEGDLVVLASGASWKMIPDRYVVDAARQIDPEMAAQALYGSFTAHVRRPTTSMLVMKVADLPARSGSTEVRKVRATGSRDAAAAKPKKEKLPAGVMQASELDAGFGLRGSSSRGAAASRSRADYGAKTAPKERSEVRKPRSSTGLSAWDRLRLTLGRSQNAVSRLPGQSGGAKGRSNVRLRKPPQMRSERGRPGWILQFIIMLALAAIFVVIGNAAISTWKSWQIGDAEALLKQAQEKQTLAATAESQVSARAMLVQAGELINRALPAKDDQATRAMATSVQANIDRMDAVVRIDKASTVVDFGPIIQDKGDVTQMVLEGQDLFVLDEGQDRMFKYALNSDGRSVQDPGKHPVLMKKGDRIDGRAVNELFYAAWMPAGQLRTQPSLFLLESGRSIVTYDNKVGPARLDVAESARWGTIQAMTGFAGGLYLLDAKLKTVSYYPPTKNGYESQPYVLVDGNGRTDLSKAVDIALDGNLYLLEGTGQVRRFTKEGRPLDFAGDLPDGKITGPKALYASASTRSLYVLDAAGERIVQYSPEGKFQRQFRAEGKDVSFKEARDLYVDEVARRAYLLTRKSLIVFDLPPWSRRGWGRVEYLSPSALTDRLPMKSWDRVLLRRDGGGGDNRRPPYGI